MSSVSPPAPQQEDPTKNVDIPPQSDTTVLNRQFEFEFTFPQDYPHHAYRGTKKWILKRWNQISKANYTRYLEKITRQGIERHSYGPDGMSEYSYKIAMGEWVRGFASGAYKFGKALFNESLEDMDNLLEFVAIWFAQEDTLIDMNVIRFMFNKEKKKLWNMVNSLLNDPNHSDLLE